MFDRISDRGLQRRIKQHVIGKRHRFFAVVQPGFEHALREELGEFSISTDDETEISGGLEFTAALDEAFLYTARTRCASRVLMRLGTFRSHDYYVLEKEISRFPWELFVHPAASVSFRASSRSSMIYHTGKLEEIFQKFMGQRLMEKSSADFFPAPDKVPEVEIVIRNEDNTAMVSLDMSGPEFYKRGSLKERVAAPLRETLASLILRESELFTYNTLIDPMCGSGTFSIEAAAMVRGDFSREREFPFMWFPFFVGKRYSNAMSRVESEEGEFNLRIITSDSHEAAVKAAAGNSASEYGNVIKPEVRDFFSYGEDDISGRTLIVLNPPYGRRIGSGDPLSLYRKIGRKLNGDLSSASVSIIVPGIEFQKALGIPFQKKILFKNGGIESALLMRRV